MNIFFTETTIIIILALFCIKMIYDNRKQKITIKNLYFYNKTLSRMYDGIRTLKHDYSNFIQAVKGYVLCNDMNGVSALIDSIYEEFKSVTKLEVFSPQIINNPAVYNLLANKYSVAEGKKISMNVEVNTDLQELNISTYDLCKILGILVDNAIEAAEESDEKIVNVRFLKEADYKILTVENSLKDSTIDIDKIFEKGISSKEDNMEHGIGLWEVKMIVDGSNDLELYNRINHLFIQELKIKDKTKKFAFSNHHDKILSR